jgi:hypothetical protein
VLSSGDTVGVTSVVWIWTPVSFQWGTSFSFWVFFDRYSDAVSHISGGEQLQGIFYAEGTINIQNSDLFATSPQFWYKVRA